MTLSAVRRRLLLPAIALCAAVVVLLFAPLPAFAAPDPDPEGGTQSLSEQLEAAARGYNEAKAKLDISQARRAQLASEAHGTEEQLSRLRTEVDALTLAAYKTGRVGGMVAILDSGSPDALFDRAMTLGARTRMEDHRLRELMQARQLLAGQQAAVDAEIKVEQEQLVELEKRRKAAERALAPVGGTTTGGPSGGTANASPAPRAPNGSWPRESCSVKDPTTSGCLTPRTLHALEQARAAGFTRHTSCFTNGSWGEHPQGRACDFAAHATGFAGVATGGDKAYGDQLAAWFVANADRLAVLYVIWYRQIWMAGTGWRVYYSGDGSPGGDHTNHVHLSVQ